MENLVYFKAPWSKAGTSVGSRAIDIFVRQLTSAGIFTAAVGGGGNIAFLGQLTVS